MSSNPISYSEWFIAKHQVEAQLLVVEAEIERQKLNLGMADTGEVWKLIDGLTSVKRGLLKAQREVKAVEPPKGSWYRRMYESARIKIYLWSVEGRLENGH